MSATAILSLLLLAGMTPADEVVVSVRMGNPALELSAPVETEQEIDREVEISVGPRDGERVARPVPVPGEASFQAASLCAASPCAVEVTGAGWWAQPKLLAPLGGSGARVALDVFPTGRLSWRLAEQRHAPSPERITLRFAETPSPGGGSAEPSSEQAPDIARPEGSVPCRTVERRVLCDVPAGHLDLVIQAPGFADHQIWGVEVEPGEAKHLGELELKAGARLAGTVLDEQSHGPIEGARVQLEPARVHLDRDPVSRKRAKLRRQKTETDGEGRFVIEGLQPGGYRVLVEKEGFAPLRSRPVTIQGTDRHDLEAPLLLGPYAELEVLLTPPVDPYGQPWKVRFFRLTEGRSFEAVRDAPDRAGAQGSWSAEGLRRGTYMLEVGTELDRSWHATEVELESGRESLSIDLPGVEVRGEISVGDDPLPATLWFGGRHGQRSIRMDADVHGEFSGYLPEEGEWEVDLSHRELQGVQALDPVDVRRVPGRRFARVSIELPETGLQGVVVDSEGVPQAAASVVVLEPAEGRRAAVLEVDGEGRFELLGLPEGSYAVQAEAPIGTSPWTPVSLRDGMASRELRLTIVATYAVTGRVMSPGGVIPGATVTVMPAFTGDLPVAPRTVTTGMDGHFTVELPTTVRQASVLVFPPGFGASAFGHAFDPDDPTLDIRVEAGAGTLELVLPPPTEEGRRATGLLLHRGAVLGVEQLVDWIRSQGGGRDAPGTMTIPAMEPGQYRLCSRAILAPASSGRSDRCTEGYLAPGGALSLDLGEASGD